MKKTFLLVPMLLGLICAKAQTNKLELGIEGGGFGSTAINSGITTVGFNSTYMAGITGMYKIGDGFFIKAGLDYDVKGFTNTVTFTSTDGNTIMVENLTHSLNYIDLPIMARVSFGDDFKFFMNVGPYFGYLMSASGYSPGIGTVPATNQTETNGFKSFDLGLSGGLGISLPVKRWVFELEARGNLGALNASNNTIIANNVSINNFSAGLLLGIRYGIH